jgi:hypothetical protein
MPRWIAIRTSGVIAIVIGAAALFLAALMILALLLAPMRDAAPLPPAVLRAVGIVAALMLGACAAWAVSTGVGIFRRRRWARVSILIAAGVFAFFGCIGVLALWLAALPMDARVDPRAAEIVRFVMVGLYGLQAALGAWWLILFNRPAAKSYFVAGAAPPSTRPLSVTLIAWYLLASAVLTALSAVVRVPVMFFGILITGWAATGVYSVFAAAGLYLGSGLLQLDENARVGSVIFFVLYAANGLVSFAGPGHDERLLALQAELHGFLRMEMPEWRGLWVSAIAGVVFVAVPIWFLIRRRAAFAAGEDRAPGRPW